MYQKVIIIGNLGRDPEMRYMPDGTAVTNFSIATNRRWTDRVSGQPIDETTWFRVSVWRNQAETANQYLSKGSKVLVEGRLKPDENGGPRTWVAQDGTVRASFEIAADNVRFLSSRNEEGSGSYQTQSHETAVTEDDDIPF